MRAGSHSRCEFQTHIGLSGCLLDHSALDWWGRKGCSSSEKARFGTESKWAARNLSDPVECKRCSAGQLVGVETATMVTVA